MEDQDVYYILVEHETVHDITQVSLILVIGPISSKGTKPEETIEQLITKIICQQSNK